MAVRQRLRTYAGRKSSRIISEGKKRKRNVFIENFVILQIDTLLESERVKDGRVNRQL